MLREGDLLVGDALFHCQQAVEKSCKSLLQARGEAFRRTHDLAELGAVVIRLEPSLEPVLEEASDLSVFAWAYRYPFDEADEPNASKATESLQLARRVFLAIVEYLPLKPIEMHARPIEEIRAHLSQGGGQ